MKNELEISEVDVLSAPTVTIINNEPDRKKSIIENTPAIFEIVENQNAVGTEPLVELDSQSEVVRWCGSISNLLKNMALTQG